MNANSRPRSPEDAITIEQRGEITVLTASESLERLDFELAGPIGEMLAEPIGQQDVPLILVDLSAVQYFGSVFIAVLLKIWKQAKGRGGMMALAGVSQQARELLHLTSLDIVWPMYDTRQEAAEALLAD